ncbi:MAG: UvrD-helicase domain-containing protein [Patescibacteria group bacterium]|nr:UvrD-helicase domain-containing protein [Patescibacteria group bacterium]
MGAINYEKELNSEQLEVVKSADGPCLVLAGAGSGKTRTIVYRVAHLIEKGVKPERILLLTFTNKAAHEMMGRVETLLGSGGVGIWGGTFHSVANRILRRLAGRIGFKNNFTILDEEDAKDMIKACVRDLNIDTRARRFPSPAVIKSIVSYATNSRTDIEAVIDVKYPNFLELADSIREAAALYEKRKREANAMDFDDMLVYLLRLLENDTAVRQGLGQGFEYILVDEYQDTNVIQAQIVMALAEGHRNVLVVGDDAQSIYSFRAANLRNILDFPTVYPNARTFRLVTNYRSTPEILNLANNIIENNREQFRKELRSVKKSFEKPNLAPLASAHEEAKFIVETILTLRDEGVRLDDMAVLFRATHHSQELEVELVKRDIPYEYRGGVKFFERAHIKDALSFLRIVGNIQDEMAWMRALTMQAGIGPAAAGRIFERARALPDAAGIAGLEIGDILERRAASGWGSFLEIWRAVAASDNLPSSLVRAICGSPYQNHLEQEYPNWRERLEDLEQLAVFAEQYGDVSSFLTEISLYDSFGALRSGPAASGDDEKIVLSTIHQAKGLEWPVVFVMHLTDQALPNRRALAEPGGVEEERRLFYVAATRAADRLYITYPLTSGYDNLSFNQPSMFIQEIDPRLFERLEMEGAPAVHRGEYADHEPVIIWDQDGEEKKSLPRRNLLREIDEL